ncbi:MAG: PGPGW domain-containing protein [Pseudomonadales bacterium]
MLEWIQNNVSDAALLWVAISVVSFVVTLVAIPLILVWIPEDYFLKSRRERPKLIKRHPVVRVTLTVIRNLIGYILILAGLVMLALPGQGLLTIFVGILLVNFPGRERMITWLLDLGKIHQTVDWMRAKAGKKPLILHEPDEH